MVELSSYQIIAISCVKACSLFTYGSHCKGVKLPSNDENEGKDPLVLKRHRIEYPGEDPVLQTHHQEKHMSQHEELYFLAEGGVGTPGGRELEPDTNNLTSHPCQCCLEPGTQGQAKYN